MRCVAIDDEPIAIAIIEQYCQRLGGIELATFTDPVEGMEYIHASSPDVVFMDVEMGEINGVELSRRLPADVGLILSTAYAKFAIDGFELNAIDFLHKPFSFDRFKRAIEKARQHLAPPPSPDKEITVKVEYQSIKIHTKDIIYIEAMDNYVRIHTSASRPITPQISMKSIEEMLPSGEFMRIHKSYIVARGGVGAYTRTHVTLRDSSTLLPIGRTFQGEFAEWIGSNG